MQPEEVAEPVSAIAQSVAETLAAELGAHVLTDVAVALYEPDGASRPEQYVDPISLGGLIVAIATLAWTIYNDRKRAGGHPDAAALAQALEDALTASADSRAAPPDARIIEVVAHETIVIGHRT